MDIRFWFQSLVGVVIALGIQCPAHAQHQHHSPLARVPDAAVASYAKGGTASQQYQFYFNTPKRIVADRLNAKTLLDTSSQLFQVGLAKSNVKAVDDQAVRVGNKWFVHYDLSYGGVPLSKTSSAMAIVDNQRAVVATRRRNVPIAVDNVEPTVSKETALQIARAESAKSFRLAQLVASEPRLEIWVDAEQQGHLAWNIKLSSPSPATPYGRRAWVSATGEPRLLASENLIYHAHRAKVIATIWSETPLGNRKTDIPLSGVQLEVHENGEVRQRGTTNENGEHVFPGFGNVDIRAQLASGLCIIEDQSTTSQVMQRNQAGDDTGSFRLDFNSSDEPELAQTTAFFWTNQAAAYCEDIFHASVEHPLKELKTRVNINDSCNAYWDGESINFFRSGGDCPNTAYSDVVIHEYGHGVDHRMGGIIDGGYSEGFGDALMILMMRQPCLGRDFLGAGTCLRDAREIIKWPPEDTEVHYVGRIYAGFVWELLQQLTRGHGEDQAYAIAKRLVLSAAAANPADIPDAVQLSFIADDDDGTLANGSPNFLELAAAADSRGIPRPSDPKLD